MAMGDVIGRLSVVLGLDTAAFESGSRMAVRTAKDTGDGMEKLGARVGFASKALIGLGAAVASSQLIGSIKNLTMQGLEYASSLGEQAQQLGVLASELQEYRYAASQAGIKTEEMDQALGQLTKRIGLASTGVGGPAKAFAELGISVRNAKGELLTAGQVFPLIAEALSKIKDPATRARLEIELFGKSGQKLDTLMTEGASGVNKLRDAAHKLGIVLSDEAIANADQTADDMDKLNTVLQAQISKFVSENAKEILALSKALLELAGSALKALNNWLDLRKGLDRRGRIIDQANEVIDNSNLSPERKSQAKRRVPILLDKKAHSGDRVIGPSWLGLRSGRPDYGQLTDSSGPMLDGTPLGNFALGDVNRSELFDIKWGEEAKTALDKMRESMEGLKLATGMLGETSIEATKKMKLGWGEAAEEVLGALDSMANAIRNGGFLDILGAVIGIGLQAGSMGLFGGKIQTNINGAKRIPGFASGTSFAPGGLALVGERGPELVNLPRGSQVIPNHALSGGGGNSYHFQGNLMTPEFWAAIQQGDMRAAAAGAQGGAARVFSSQRRRVA